MELHRTQASRILVIVRATRVVGRAATSDDGGSPGLHAITVNLLRVPPHKQRVGRSTRIHGSIGSAVFWVAVRMAVDGFAALAAVTMVNPISIILIRAYLL